MILNKGKRQLACISKNKGDRKVEYHHLISKFFAGEITDNELVLLKSWLKMNPENQRIFNEENELWHETSFKENLEYFNTDTAWKSISLRLAFGNSNDKLVKIVRRKNFRILTAAAVIAVLIAIGGISLWIAEITTSNRYRIASCKFVTNYGEKAHIFLADSTEVFLNSGSSLEYNGQYNIKDRIIKFSGEAFFEVVTNPKKPFVVKLNQVSVTATGTRFNIHSYSNDDYIETTLEEGAIQVSIEGKEPINVKSGQQVVYLVGSKSVLVRDVVVESFTSWKENKLQFYDTPFEQLLREIGRKYNVKFEIASRELLNLTYTGTFIDESIDEVMQMLKTVSPITYEINNLTSVNDKQYLKPTIVVGKAKHYE